MSLEQLLPTPEQRPAHVAIIMDGNGRWATDRGLSRLEGHRKGADVVRDITTYARELGIAYLTLYSFSRQNWRRPPAEVAGLMLLLEEFCERERATLMSNNIRMHTIGDLWRLPPSTRAALENLTAVTKDNTAMTLTLALDYGGREELVAAVGQIAAKVKAGELDPAAIDEEVVAQHLYTHQMPDPDLLIRTSGELRVSNFLLWQIAYAELYFTPARWPDFSREIFSAALKDFAGRERRFGATSAQILGR